MLDDEVPLIGCWFTLDNYVLVVEGQKIFDKAKDFVLASSSSRFVQKYRYDYFIFKRKVAGVDAVQVLILGAECSS
jgi:hypothetical protein